MAGIPAWRLWALTRSEVLPMLSAARILRQREHDMAVFVAWRTATLTRARKVPRLARLLKPRRRRSSEEQAQIRAEVAEAEASFARLEAEAYAANATEEGVS